MNSRRIAVLLICVFLTVACQSSLLADLLTQPGSALYQDDFSDPSSGWARTGSANGGMDYADGAYRVLVQTAGYDLWSVSGHAYGDVTVEADATRLAGPDANRFGLICRYRDAENFYFFVISSDGYSGLGKVSGSQASLLGQQMMLYSASILPGAGPNHLRFDCVGNTLTAYVNDQPVAIAEDSAYPDGDAGLLVGAFDQSGVDISFDNFVVTKP